ncbi:MAG: endonuclease-3 [Flavobacteriaceae bacterium]|jgi:endonuclease-3
MTQEKLKERKKRFKKLYKELVALLPRQMTALNFSNPWELVIAVSLSAQCTDKQVNKVTEKLFKKYKTLEDYCNADISEFEKDIYSTGFYKNKAKNVLAAAKTLRDEFDGIVPQTVADLIVLSGVGRKTAHVVLKNGFGIAEGIAVDTHVIRFCVRYDLSDFTDAVRIEKDLMNIVPREDWVWCSYYMIWYGRLIAPAKRYDTSKDPLLKIYPAASERFRV